MDIRQTVNVIGAMFLGTILTEIAYYLVMRWKSGKFKAYGLGTVKTLFFPDREVACKDHFIDRHGCTNQRCKFSHDANNSYGQLLRFLSSTRISLEVCVYTITCADLAGILIDLHNMGVIVKVITDGEQQNSLGSQINRFREAGIQVRLDKSSYFMHHKFVIIDGQMLLNGSFNWTRQAVTGNHENLIVTTCPELLLKYKNEFDKLWKLYEPKVTQI